MVYYDTMLKEIIDSNDKIIYHNFVKICMYADKDDLQMYINKYNIDVNYHDGYYIELIAERNYLELLKVMLDAGVDITINNYNILKSIAHEGDLELLDYVVTRYNVDCSVILGTSAYNNHKCIKEYIDNNIKKIIFI
jgi:hypothetical protein